MFSEAAELRCGVLSRALTVMIGPSACSGGDLVRASKRIRIGWTFSTMRLMVSGLNRGTAMSMTANYESSEISGDAILDCHGCSQNQVERWPGGKVCDLIAKRQLGERGDGGN